MRLSTAACVLALLGMLGASAPSQAQDLVERVRAATGSKPKPAAKAAPKSKPKSKAKPKAKPKPKPKAVARSKPSKKSPPPPEPTPVAVPEREPEPTLAPAPSPPPAPPSNASKPTPAEPAPAPLTPSAEPSAESALAVRSPEPSDATGPAPETTATPAASAPPGTTADAPSPSGLQLALFVDAYAGWQSSGSGTLATLSNHRAFSGQGSTLRAENGAGLAFLGLDVSYASPHVGATANLRFGEGVPIYHVHPTGESDAAFGVELLTQAYLTWRPWQVLALDLGMFNTPFGAEVLESWKNLNYTRGALYYYAQPAWHTGLRAQWDPNDTLSLVGFVANGSNIISETQQDAGLNQTPTLGAQLGLTLSDALWLGAGGLFTTDGYDNDDSGFDALGDLVLRFEQGRLQAVLNADYVLTRMGAPDGSDRHFFGVSAAAGYAFSELLGVATRGEWLLDDASYGDAANGDGESERWRLFTVTLTTELKPFDAAPNLILRWDNRWEESNQQVFGKSAGGTADTDDDSYADVWFQSVLGVVVTTAP